jgi:hypothetical protein
MAASNRTLRPDALTSGSPQRMLQHAGDTATCGTFTPEDDSPTALVIGARASKRAVQRLAERHRLQPEDLYAFQDNRTTSAVVRPSRAPAGWISQWAPSFARSRA